MGVESGQKRDTIDVTPSYSRRMQRGARRTHDAHPRPQTQSQGGESSHDPSSVFAFLRPIILPSPWCSHPSRHATVGDRPPSPLPCSATVRHPPLPCSSGRPLLPPHATTHASDLTLLPFVHHTHQRPAHRSALPAQPRQPPAPGPPRPPTLTAAPPPPPPAWTPTWRSCSPPRAG